VAGGLELGERKRQKYNNKMHVCVCVCTVDHLFIIRLNALSVQPQYAITLFGTKIMF